MGNDPAKSFIVSARLPQKILGHAKFIVDPHTRRTLVESGRRAALGEYVGLIFQGGILESPVAIFEGIKRPYISDGDGNFIFVYISNPKLTYYYAPRDQFDGTGPHPDAAPKESVFTVFVSLSRTMVEASTSGGQSADGDIRGVILAWEWTKASGSDPRLPEFYQTRYRRVVWLPE